jgi:hypothetical protein
MVTGDLPRMASQEEEEEVEEEVGIMDMGEASHGDDKDRRALKQLVLIPRHRIIFP